MEVVNLQYFGNSTLYKTIVVNSYAEISLYDRYEKSLHLNRTVISGANGLINLNIPLVGGREQQRSLSDIKVSTDKHWQKIHLRSIVSSYRRAPWYDHYHDELTEFYKLDFDYLWEWNIESIRMVCRLLKFEHHEVRLLKQQTKSSLSLSQQSDQTLSDPAFKPLPYPQVFSDRFGFIPGLSILDTLFCLGPKATRDYIISR